MSNSYLDDCMSAHCPFTSWACLPLMMTFFSFSPSLLAPNLPWDLKRLTSSSFSLRVLSVSTSAGGEGRRTEEEDAWGRFRPILEAWSTLNHLLWSMIHMMWYAVFLLKMVLRNLWKSAWRLQTMFWNDQRNFGRFKSRNLDDRWTSLMLYKCTVDLCPLFENTYALLLFEHICFQRPCHVIVDALEWAVVFQPKSRPDVVNVGDDVVHGLSVWVGVDAHLDFKHVDGP